MKPFEVAIENSLKLKEFESQEKAKDYFFQAINISREALKLLFNNIFNIEVSYNIEFLNIFDKVVKECIAKNKYKEVNLTLKDFDRAIGVYVYDFIEKNRYGKIIVREDSIIKGRYNVGIEEANGYCFHMGLQLTTVDYIHQNANKIAYKKIKNTFHLPNKFKSKYLNEKMIASINNFNDKRYSINDPGLTVSSYEQKNFKTLDLKPFFNELHLFFSEEKKPSVRDEVYHYLQYYCWETQDREVCQFLIDRLKFEESTSIRKHFFWSRLDEIKNLETYDLSELIKIANDSDDKNSKHCQKLLNKNKIKYS